MYKEFVKKLHLELTSNCNARCPQCVRTFKQTPYTDPTLPLNELTLEDITKVLDDPRCSQVTEIYINGNYGDIVMHSDPLPIIKEINSRNIILRIHTNGSGLSDKFWQELGKLQNLEVIFAIDGLEDTHSLYRRNTRYDVILNNAETFISAGGNATWQFIEFNHNTHQIELAKKLAKKKQFSSFLLLDGSSRFGSSNALSIKDKDFEHKYYLEVNGVTDKTRRADTTKRKELEHLYDNPKYLKLKTIDAEIPKGIKCDAKDSQTLYISYDQRLWPCCFFGTAFDLNERNRETNNIMKLFEQQIANDYNFNNISKRTVSEILQDVDSFKVVEVEWTQSTLCDVCNNQCSTDGIWTRLSKRTKEQTIK